MDAINSIAGTLLVSQETPSQQSFAWGTCDSVTGAMASVILDGDTEAIELPMESGARGMEPATDASSHAGAEKPQCRAID